MTRQDPADSVESTSTEVPTSNIPEGNGSYHERVVENVLEFASPVDKSEEVWDNLEDNWENDPDNARNWPIKKKWTAVVIVRTMAFYRSVPG